MNTNDELFLKPYEARRFGYFGRAIYFEGEMLVAGAGGDLDRIVAMLNGAYNLGRHRELLTQELNNRAMKQAHDDH